METKPRRELLLFREGLTKDFLSTFVMLELPGRWNHYDIPVSGKKIGAIYHLNII